MTAGTEKKICNLIARYRGSDGAKFRNAFRDAVASLPQTEARILLEIRDCAESWASGTSADLVGMLARWSDLRSRSKEVLPASIVIALLRIVPERFADAPEWSSFLADCHDVAVADAVTGRHLVGPKYLMQMARQDRPRFVQSAALDVMLRRRWLKDPAVVRDSLVAMSARPKGLLSRDEALVACYAGLPHGKREAAIVALLCQHPEVSATFVDSLLTDSGAVSCFLEFLLSRCGQAGIRDVLDRFVLFCGGIAANETGSRRAVASFALARVALFARASSASRSGSSYPADLAISANTAVLAQMLRDIEEASASGDRETVTLVDVQQLRSAMTELRRNAPQIIGQSTGNVGYQDYARCVDVIRRVVVAMEEAAGSNQLRDALDVALFNMGVRRIGTTGATVVFDYRRHDAESPGMFPGDPAVVTRAGYMLGDEPSGLVLLKAKIAPQTGKTEDGDAEP